MDTRRSDIRKILMLFTALTLLAITSCTKSDDDQAKGTTGTLFFNAGNS